MFLGQSQSKKVYTVEITKETKTPDQKAFRLLDGNTNPNIIKSEILEGNTTKRGAKVISACNKTTVRIKFINKNPIPEDGRPTIRNIGLIKKYKAETPNTKS